MTHSNRDNFSKSQQQICSTLIIIDIRYFVLMIIVRKSLRYSPRRKFFPSYLLNKEYCKKYRQKILLLIIMTNIYTEFNTY